MSRRGDRRTKRRPAGPGRRKEDLPPKEEAAFGESQSLGKTVLTQVDGLNIATVEAFKKALGSKRGRRQISPDQVDVLVFEAGRHRLGIELHKVEEVCKVPEIIEVPGADEVVVGVVNLRGRIIPVWETAGLLGLGEAADSYVKVIVVKTTSNAHALLAEVVHGVRRLDKGGIEEPPPMGGRLGAAARGVVHGQDGMLVLLQPEVLFSEWE